MNIGTCPLCKGNEIKIIEPITAKELNELYFQTYQVEILYLFNKNEIFFCKCGTCALKFFEPSVIGDEHFYNVLQKSKLYYMEEKEEYDFATKYIRPKDNVLDIGCGKGAFSKKINPTNFTGLELSARAREIGEEGGINILNQTIQEHSISNKEKYDVVCAFQVLEHVNCHDLFNFLEACIVSLKENGLLILSVPSDDSFIAKMTNSALNLPPHHQTRWPDKTLKEIAKIFNLAIMEFHHDKLDSRHKDEYLRVIVTYLQTTKHRLISKKNNILQKISSRLINLLNLKIRRFIINGISPRGHSITVIYKKIL